MPRDVFLLVNSDFYVIGGSSGDNQIKSIKQNKLSYILIFILEPGELWKYTL